MVATNKKHICSELLHIALVITLLRGHDNRFYRRSPVISTNFFNDVSVSNDIMGPSWAYSRTSFHHFYRDPPLHEIKALEGNLAEDFMELTDDDLDIDLNIINQLRSLTLSRFNSLPTLGKDQPTFQDITAYLLSESTSPSNAVPAPPVNVVDYESPLVSPTEREIEMTELTQVTSLPSSPGGDSGHEETSDDADEISTNSDSMKEFPLDVEGSTFSRNSQRRESHGFHSDSEEELVAHEILLRDSESLIAAAQDDTLAARGADQEVPENEHQGQQSETKQEDATTHVETMNILGLWDEWLDDVPGDTTSLHSPPSELDQTLIELLEHVHQNEVGGAAGIDHSNAALSQLLLSPDSEYLNIPGAFLDAERSSLEFYKKFNDISESELHNVVAPQDLHEFVDDDNALSSSSSGLRMKLEDTEGAKQEEVDSDNNDTMEEEATQNILSALFDDILEGDSGVFDFLDSESAHGDIAHDDLSENSHDSITEVPAVSEDSAGSTEGLASDSEDMMHFAPFEAQAGHSSSHFQVHGRMPGLLRGGSVEQRWHDLANILSLQSSSLEPNGLGMHPSHDFQSQPHQHLHHHTPQPLQYAMNSPHVDSGVLPATPYSTDTARSVLLQNATLPPPELLTTGPYANVGIGASSNLGSAVATSMHLTNSSEPMVDPSSLYKIMDPSHDMLFYQNSTNEMANQTSTDGFNLSSILNDDELQLMDMAMSEGMYPMRVMDNAIPSSSLTTIGSLGHGLSSSATLLGAAGGSSTEDRMEASSDSAVSSMGSERVSPMTDPPISENGWEDNESQSQGSHDLRPGKLYYKGGSRVAGGPAVAQKKHQMFGKRFQQDQGSHQFPSSHLPYLPDHGTMSGGSSVDLDYEGSVGQESEASGPLNPTLTNHTYALPPTHPDNPVLKVAKQAQKEKQKLMKYLKTDEALTRDERKARSMNIPITADDIINLPMEEFNERLSKYDLEESQLTLVRDIRRRGKNKVAAQNCRKRKLDQILQLADEVQRIRERKLALKREQDVLSSRRSDLKERYGQLYRKVFKSLRDSDGNSYSPFEFTLNHAADGSVMMVPRDASQPSTSTSSNENGLGHSTNGRRDKPKEESEKE